MTVQKFPKSPEYKPTQELMRSSNVSSENRLDVTKTRWASAFKTLPLLTKYYATIPPTCLDKMLSLKEYAYQRLKDNVKVKNDALFEALGRHIDMTAFTNELDAKGWFKVFAYPFEDENLEKLCQLAQDAEFIAFLKANDTLARIVCTAHEWAAHDSYKVFFFYAVAKLRQTPLKDFFGSCAYIEAPYMVNHYMKIFARLEGLAADLKTFEDYLKMCTSNHLGEFCQRIGSCLIILLGSEFFYKENSLEDKTLMLFNQVILNPQIRQALLQHQLFQRALEPGRQCPIKDGERLTNVAELLLRQLEENKPEVESSVQCSSAFFGSKADSDTGVQHASHRPN